MAATMVAWCRKNRIACGFASNGMLQGADKETAISLNPLASPQHYDNCMELLARIIMQRRTSFPQLMRQMGSQLPSEPADIVVLSCYWNDEMEQAAQHLRGLGHGVTYYPVVLKEEA